MPNLPLCDKFQWKLDLTLGFSFLAGAEEAEDMTSIPLLPLPFAGAISFLSIDLMSHSAPCSCYCKAPRSSFFSAAAISLLLGHSQDKEADIGHQLQQMRPATSGTGIRSVPCNICQNLCKSLFHKY